MAKFRDIERAAELQAQATALARWRALDRAGKRTAYASAISGNGGRVKVNRVPGYIKPFGFLSTQNIFLEALVLDDGIPTVVTGEETASDIVGALVPALAGLTSQTKADTDVALPMRKFKFAKVMVKSKSTTGGTQKTSRFTDNPYTAYPSQTVTAPFGQPPAGDSFEAVCDSIRRSTALTSWLAAEGSWKRSLKFIPQMTVVQA